MIQVSYLYMILPQETIDLVLENIFDKTLSSFFCTCKKYESYKYKMEEEFILDSRYVFYNPNRDVSVREMFHAIKSHTRILSTKHLSVIKFMAGSLYQ